MAANNINNDHSAMSFWDFLQSLDPNQASGSGGGTGDQRESGQQFPPGFPFPHGNFSGRGAWGGRGGPSFGGRGRGNWTGFWGGRGSYPGQPWDENSSDNPFLPNNGEEGPSETANKSTGDADNNNDNNHHHPHDPRPFYRGRGRGRGRGSCGRGAHGCHRGPPPPYPGNFYLPPWMDAFQNHPFAQAAKQYFEQYAAHLNGGLGGESDQEGVFNPAIDIFNRPTQWQIHVALPGAEKEDVSVNWDADKSTLKVTGVVYRPGDEEFLESLIRSERKVGLFDSSIKLPTTEGDENDEVNGEGILARLEDGVLFVTVPKIEKDRTEVRKVDIH